MSHVTGVVVHTGCWEDRRIVDTEIYRWLTMSEDPMDPLFSVEDMFAGPKHPQVFVHGGGYNYFDEEEFVEYFLTLEWAQPERVVLLITTESNPTRIFYGGKEITKP